MYEQFDIGGGYMLFAGSKKRRTRSSRFRFQEYEIQAVAVWR